MSLENAIVLANPGWIKADNKRFIEGFAKTGEHIEVIDSDYEQIIEKASRL